ncbi:MAG TPA: aminoglycoside phosphotransferase family protein [Bryobacteraceae bacterium]|nr:aminoglycoside phosphotransferase family protein [Bryobacteraceae bacterium]
MLARHWCVDVESAAETETSLFAFGKRGTVPVVIKVLRNRRDDEWRSGEILAAFGGRGVVRVYDYIDGAVLLERLRPGSSLAELVLNGSDECATEILAEVIASMSPGDTRRNCATTHVWSKAFDWYTTTGDRRIARRLVDTAHDLYSMLSNTQSRARLLHGDLHHYNVVFDSDRGWLAIDPKGIVGEVEFETGAALRNPFGRPELFTPRAIENRLKQFGAALGINEERALMWSFAQAVLSAIWLVEDRFPVGNTTPSLVLANAILPMLGAQGAG